MDWINYHHLRYFWTVAKYGSIGEAARRLYLSHPTVCAQLKELEESLAEKLFRREGRKLVLTDAGRTLYQYADQIFTLGQEMVNAVKQRPSSGPMRLAAGVTHSVPRMAAANVFQPVLDMTPHVNLICQVGNLAELLGRVASCELDLVLSDVPAEPASVPSRKVYNHKLGDTSISFFASPRLAEQLRANFPQSLHEAPMLLPTTNMRLRQTLEAWFQRHRIRPQIVAEFESFPIMNRFGQLGYGCFASYTVAADALSQTYAVTRIGEAEGAREMFYIITPERKIEHPGVRAIAAAAEKNFHKTVETVAARNEAAWN